MTVVLTSVALLAVAWAASPVQNRFAQRIEIDSLTKGIALRSGDNQQLRDEIKKLRNDPHYIELLARKDLGLIKEGEKAYVVIEPDEKNSKKVKAPPAPPKNLWQQLEVAVSKKLRF